jgi:hypothetical protein
MAVAGAAFGRSTSPSSELFLKMLQWRFTRDRLNERLFTCRFITLSK